MAGLLLGFFLTAAGDRPGAVPISRRYLATVRRGPGASRRLEPFPQRLVTQRPPGVLPWIILASAAFARWGEAPSAPMGRAKKYSMGNSP